MLIKNGVQDEKKTLFTLKLAFFKCKVGRGIHRDISFHTFRHWKATMLYHQTKDIYYVMHFLGHRNINNTLKYIQLEEALFKRENEDYICKVASTIEEAKELIETGFEYVCEFNEAF